MWNKSLEINWKAHFGGANEVEPAPNQGAEGPTANELRRLDTYIKKFLKVVEIPDVGNRRRMARALIAFGDRLDTAAPDQFDDSGFKHENAVDFPEIPGEEQRNSALSQIRDRYNQPRDADGNVPPGLRRQHSRASSFTGSDASGFGVEGGLTTPRAASPRRPHANKFPTERTSSDRGSSSPTHTPVSNPPAPSSPPEPPPTP
jgi:hypothetical protein